MPYKDKNKRRTAQSKWIKENTKGFYIRLNVASDLDIIQHLSTKENKQGFVKELIRADLARETGKAMQDGFNAGLRGSWEQAKARQAERLKNHPDVLE